MNAYGALAASYDRLTNDVDYEGWVDFAQEILKREGLHPKTVADLACGTGAGADGGKSCRTVRPGMADAAAGASDR